MDIQARIERLRAELTKEGIPIPEEWITEMTCLECNSPFPLSDEEVEFCTLFFAFPFPGTWLALCDSCRAEEIP